MFQRGKKISTIQELCAMFPTWRRGRQLCRMARPMKFFARYEFDYFRLIEADTPAAAFERCAELDQKRPEGQPGIQLERLESFCGVHPELAGREEFYAPELGFWIRTDNPAVAAGCLLDGLVKKQTP